MSERHIPGYVIVGGIVVFVGAVAVLGLLPDSVTQPKSLLADGTTTPTSGEVATATPITGQDLHDPRANNPNYLYDAQTDTYFRKVPHPYASEGATGECVELGVYTPTDQQDVYGAVVSFGDSNTYLDQFIIAPLPNSNGTIDTPPINVTVFDANKQVIGSFVNTENPDPGLYSEVSPGTVVCNTGHVTLALPPTITPTASVTPTK